MARKKAASLDAAFLRPDMIRFQGVETLKASINTAQGE
jgi:hypothetical protein